MRTYTVQQLAKMAKVSVRTLHHYDQIGLLKPRARPNRVIASTEKRTHSSSADPFYKELEFPRKR